MEDWENLVCPFIETWMFGKWRVTLKSFAQRLCNSFASENAKMAASNNDSQVLQMIHGVNQRMDFEVIVQLSDTIAEHK